MAARTTAAILSVALLFGGTQAAASTTTPGVDPATADGPTTVPALQQSLQILEGLVTSVTPATGDVRAQGAEFDPVGWILSAAGIAVSAATAAEQQQELEQISSQISQVQTTLNQIQTQLQTLSNEIAELEIQTAKDNCSVQTQFATEALANVQAAGQQYNTLVTQAANASASDPAPSMATLINWAETWADDLQVSIDDIQDVVGGTVQDVSSLQACASALAQGIDTGAWQFEAEYYNDLYLYVAYWYGAEVQALNLYTEAQHVLALNASGNAKQLQATDPSAVCDPPVKESATQTACNNAQDMVNVVTGDVTNLITQAGAAYAWGTEGQAVGAGPPGAKNAFAWLLDINDFQTSGCTLPLNSTTPCGGTVGTSRQFANSTWGGYSWGSYTNWQPAPTAAWLATDALPQTTVTQVFQQLQSEGLGDATWGFGSGLAGLIIYTGETTSSQQSALNQNGYQNSITGQCMLDTSFWLVDNLLPLCDSAGGGLLSNLVANYDSKTKYWNWPEDMPWQPSVQTFYQFTLNYYKDNGPWNVSVIGLPEWATSTYAFVNYQPGPMTVGQDAAPEYRWPVLPLTDSMCTVPLTSTQTMSVSTESGVPTMCGPDMAAWLAQQVPEPPPSVSSPLSLTARHGLGKAKVTWRPGSRLISPKGYRIHGKRNDGHWTTLVRNTASKKHSHRISVPRQGTWRFKVTSLTKFGRSRPSRASRPEYIPTKRMAHRYYAFANSSGAKRIVKVFSDGRVYWNSKRRSGVGTLHRHRPVITGHTYRDHRSWTGTWRQRTAGSWRHLRWVCWDRIDGPAKSRKGMPLRRTHLPKY